MHEAIGDEYTPRKKSCKAGFLRKVLAGLEFLRRGLDKHLYRAHSLVLKAYYRQEEKDQAKTKTED